jgi:hypothetical protein
VQLVWDQCWFKKSDLQAEKVTSKEQAHDEVVEENKKLFCTSCKNYITDLEAAISINGAHTHTFSNPTGLIYTINCFQPASGCQTIGDSTDEYTWFSGYEWQIAICRSCREQLGWLFSNSNQFYGLISDRLTHMP